VARQGAGRLDRIADATEGWVMGDQFYEDNGYYVARTVLPRSLVRTVGIYAENTIRAYEGKLLRHKTGLLEVNEFVPSTNIVCNSPFNPHLTLPEELSELRTALCDLITADSIGQTLHKLDGVAHYVIAQTILFITAQNTDWHIDGWAVDMDARPHDGHTLWIPLEDMAHTSGIPAVAAWPRKHLVSEESLGIDPTLSVRERYDRYHDTFNKRLLAKSPQVVSAVLRAGDFMVWAPLTPHCSLPPLDPQKTRLSLQVLVRPAKDADATRMTDWFSFLNL
jgi:hypothetical protein